MHDHRALARLRWRIIWGMALTQFFVALGTVLPGGLPSDSAYACTVLLWAAIAVWAVHWAESSRLVKNIILAAVFFLVSAQLLEITENFEALSDVPLLGSNSKWNGRYGSFGLITGLVLIFTALLFALVETRLGRIAQDRYGLLAEHVSDVIFTADLNLMPTYVSPSVTRLRGLTVEEALAQPPEESMTPASVERSRHLLLSQLRRLREGLTEPGAAAAIDLELYRKDGSTVWVEMGVSFLLDPEGQPYGILGVVRDITERKRAEDAASQLAERLTLAVGAGNLGVWDWDVQTDELVWDERMFEIYGVDSSQAETIYKDWKKYVEPEDLAQSVRELMEAVAGRGEFQSQFRVVHTGGAIRHIQSRAVVLRDGDGKPLRVIGMNADITEQVEADAERSRLQEQLAQAQKMESVGRLAGGVAHDFNNMLLVILGHADLASNAGDVNGALQYHVEEIRKAALRSADLTRQLLAFARQQPVTPRAVDMNQATADMLKMLERLIGEGIRLTWRPGEGLWRVKLDPSQADQVLANLCVNARDAIGEFGEIVIESRNVTLEAADHPEEPTFEPGDYVRLTISDNGCGMDRATLARIFEPFYTTKKPGMGTGLGLSTVYGIVRQNRGFIRVASEPGRGTTFTIDLPRYMGGAVTAPRESGATAVTPRGSEVVLVVEDEAAILALAHRMLERLGYTVIAAATPGEALRLAASSDAPIQLLLTDIVMPEMNGRDLAAELKARYPDMKHMYMSGYTADVISQDEIQREGAHFIQKPFGIADLAAKVREALDRRGGGPD